MKTECGARNLDTAFAEFCDREGYPNDGPMDEALRAAFHEGAALAAQSQGAQAAPVIEYVPIATGSRDAVGGAHPNDKIPADPACGAALDARGDDRGQGLDPYWKWGFRAGWHDRAALAAKAEAPALTPLDYRAQGREEALAIILAESAEDPFSECTGWSKSGAPDDEGGAYWKEDELRALLNIGDRKHDAYDRAEAAYWEALGRRDEAARELLFAQQAPFYKPLHDFLSKHEAWDLMGDLKRAQQAAAPGALADWKLVPDEPTDQMTYIGQKMRYDPVNSIGAIYCAMLAAAPSAPGTPEAPKGGDAKDAARFRWLRDHHIGDDPEAINLQPAKRSGLSAAVDAAMRAAQLDGGQGEGA